MGKNKAIKILAKQIANKVIHQILAMHTNRPESIHFLKAEEDNYRVISMKKIMEFNWNEYDKKEIKLEALRMIKKMFDLKYPDVNFNKNEIEIKLDVNIKDFFES